MTRRRFAWMTLTVLVLTAGCGGGSDPAEPAGATATATTASPASYSAAELVAALPTAKDLPGGLTLSRTCPADDEGCTMYPKGLVVAEIEAEPASPVGAEQIQDQVTPKDFVAVQAQRYPDATAAATVDRTIDDDLHKFEGAYEVTRDDGRTSRGKGSMDELEIGAWTGLVHRRTEVSSDADTDKGLLIATSTLTSGLYRLTVFVSLSAAGREPVAAADLGDSLLREYIERLES